MMPTHTHNNNTDTIKGWEFGGGVRMACTNVDGTFYAIQGSCPRCAFDLWKGDLIKDDPGFENKPLVACPTCSTIFSFQNGKYGPPMKRTGLQAFVGNLAKTATQEDSYYKREGICYYYRWWRWAGVLFGETNGSIMIHSWGSSGACSLSKRGRIDSTLLYSLSRRTRT